MRSAGLLPFRFATNLEVLLAHPGGPYFANKDSGWWSIVKGLVEEDEDDFEAASREFQEETGWPPPDGVWIPLGETILRSRKRVVAWGVESEFDPKTLKPGLFTMRSRQYPEIDRVEWMTLERASRKLNKAQMVFLDRLADHLEI